MAKKVIEIPQDICNEIQALQYECNSRQGLLAYMLDRGSDIASTGFKHYHDEYNEFNAKYEQAKEKLQKTILEPQIHGKLLSWNLDFESNECTCDYAEEN